MTENGFELSKFEEIMIEEIRLRNALEKQKIAILKQIEKDLGETVL